jgi:hypothetical protein
VSPDASRRARGGEENGGHAGGETRARDRRRHLQAVGQGEERVTSSRTLAQLRGEAGAAAFADADAGWQRLLEERPQKVGRGISAGWLAWRHGADQLQLRQSIKRGDDLG